MRRFFRLIPKRYLWAAAMILLTLWLIHWASQPSRSPSDSTTSTTSTSTTIGDSSSSSTSTPTTLPYGYIDCGPVLHYGKNQRLVATQYITCDEAMRVAIDYENDSLPGDWQCSFGREKDLYLTSCINLTNDKIFEIRKL